MQSSQTNVVAYNVIERAYNVIVLSIKQSFRLSDQFDRAFNSGGIHTRKTGQMTFAAAENRIQITRQMPCAGQFSALSAPASTRAANRSSPPPCNPWAIRFVLVKPASGWQQVVVTTGHHR
jgi:hypothetical protein